MGGHRDFLWQDGDKYMKTQILTTTMLLVVSLVSSTAIAEPAGPICDDFSADQPMPTQPLPGDAADPIPTPVKPQPDGTGGYAIVVWTPDPQQRPTPGRSPQGDTTTYSGCLLDDILACLDSGTADQHQCDVPSVINQAVTYAAGGAGELLNPGQGQSPSGEESSPEGPNPEPDTQPPPGSPDNGTSPP